MGFSWQELILVLLIVLVLFGPKKLPEIGSSLGRGIRGFKDSLNGSEPAEKAPAPAQISAATPVAQPVPVEVVETTTPAGDSSSSTSAH